MPPLVGYCDRWSVKPGGTIRFMVSSADDGSFDLRFVRLICADPNPEGPGYRAIAAPSPIDGTTAGRFQPAHPGSFAAVERLDLGDLADGLTLSATVWPTTPTGMRRGLIALDAGGWRVALAIDATGGAAIAVTSPAGAQAEVVVAVPMQPREWYDVVATIDPASARITVSQHARRPYATIRDDGSAAAALPGWAPPRAARVLLAALPDDAGLAHGHLNGKLERPCLWRGAAAAAALTAQRHAAPAARDGLIAAWDFARDIASETARDVGPQAAHARLVNLPTRAMTGSRWTGAVHDWKQAPEQYGAIHFHDDDVGDLGWQESAALTVPADWPSGFYAAEIRSDAGEDMIPFFVRPAQPRSDVAFLVPTFTYQVYGSFRRPGRGADNHERAKSWGALLPTPDQSPEFGLSTYNVHSDGSGVAIVSMRRPMLDTRPRQISLMDPAPRGSGTGRICADSYVVHWLSAIGVEHDIITDHDLDEEGLALLAPYRVVIAGQHPEYHSSAMLDALDGWLAGGGRLIYLGGNGFYWRAARSAAAPYALEVRRAEGGIRTWATEPGESYHGFTGEYGGLWRRIGRPAHRLVGNGFSSQGRHLGFPYRFTAAITDSRVAFMVEGLAERAVPDAVFGDSGFMGGGAAGFELDSADVARGTPPHALVIAKGVVIHPDYSWVNEDMLTIRHPRKQEDWSCADIVFFETAAGGAVFSVGSMTYVGSLASDPVLARLTTNVLQRFRDPRPFG
jgi:N,N-dimethylformamidase